MIVPNALFLNGPRAGELITLPAEGAPEKVIVATFVRVCSHRPEITMPTLNIEYDVVKTVGKEPTYILKTLDDTLTNAYFCMECKAEYDAKYNLRKIRTLINFMLDDEDDE